MTTIVPVWSVRSRSTSERRRRVVEARERLVEQHEPGSCRSARSSASRCRSRARSRATRSSRALREPRAEGARLTRRARSADAVEPPEELEVLARREVAVEIQIVAEHADAAAQRVAPLGRRPVAVAHFARRTGARASTARRAASTCPRRWDRRARSCLPARHSSDTRDNARRRP